MNCNRVVSENLIERYLDGKLDEPTRDALELHYFDCESCLATLQAVQAVRPVIAQMPRPKNSRLVVWLALAASVTVALIVWPKQNPAPTVVQAPQEPAKLALLQLSAIEPAPYSPALFRDGAAAPPPALQQAMQLYQQRQWPAAAAALSAIPNPPPAALHFAGVSHLLAGHTAPALAALDRVIALGAASPFEEEARFYRAQALLLDGRAADARAELESVVNTRGDYEVKARALLGKL